MTVCLRSTVPLKTEKSGPDSSSGLFFIPGVPRFSSLFSSPLPGMPVSQSSQNVFHSLFRTQLIFKNISIRCFCSSCSPAQMPQTILRKILRKLVLGYLNREEVILIVLQYTVSIYNILFVIMYFLSDFVIWKCARQIRRH